MNNQIRKTAYLFLIFLATVNHTFAASIRVSGFVRDQISNETLIGANVFTQQTNTGTFADNRGYFSLKVNTPCQLTISYAGYSNKTLYINNTSDTLMVIYLETRNNLEEVTVTAPQENSFAAKRLTGQQLQSIPSLSGKPDVLKALQLLPGVHSQSEGLSMIMVRGGEPGQNLYLLDNVPLIYVNHLGGFMSVFNPDMINTVDFYKGNYPASHGGKLSSIIDITQREGDRSKHKGSFSIGVTDVSFTFEGPLVNKKMSYMLTARKTLTDALFALASTLSENNTAIFYYGFHDINAKINWKPNNKNNLSFNLYQGDDYLHYWMKPWVSAKNERIKVEQKWGNWLISGRWNRTFGSKLYAENILSLSRYRNIHGQYMKSKADSVWIKENLEYSSSVNDYTMRTTWKYAFLTNWQMEFGGALSYLQYEPYNYSHSASALPTANKQLHSLEAAAYLDNKISILPWLRFDPSFRYTYYTNQGKEFIRFEPRINLMVKLSPKHSVNLNYTDVSQNSHLVFTRSLILKREIWLPASQFIPPPTSKQYVASWKGEFFEGKWAAETNFYYKNMNNLSTLKEGFENMYGITTIENKLEINGRGEAYGAESIITKQHGKWKGSASYHLSFASRQFENINEGKKYEYDFNRKHNFTISLNRELPKKWAMNIVWVFQSGLPYTPALGKQLLWDQYKEDFVETGLIYGKKNSGRMRPYHRLDIAFTKAVTSKRGNEALWTFALYNAYSHINPNSYYYDNDNERENFTDLEQSLQLYKFGLFPLIPSVSYKVFFDYSHKKINKYM